jgi:MFS family permease
LSSGRVLTPVGFGIALSLLGDQTLYTVLPNPEIMKQAGVSLTTVGIVLGLNRLTRIISNGPVGLLYDRSNRRGLMIISIGVGAASTLCYVLAAGESLLLIGRVLWGIAWSGIWIGANTMALDASSQSDRGRVSGRLQMWFFLGVAASSLIGGLLTDVFGYRGGLLVSTGLTILGVLIWMVSLPETRKKSMSEKDHASRENPKDTFPWKTAFSASVPYFALRFVIAGVLTASTILWLSQFTDGALELQGITVPLATLTGGFVAVRVLISMISAPASGTISDKFGNRWAILSFALLIGAAGLWVMGLSNPLFAIPGAFLATISGGGIQGLVPAVVGDRTSESQQSRALSVVFIVGDLGSALGPPVGLLLIPIFGLGDVYQLCALLYGAVFFFAVWNSIKERRAVLAATQPRNPPGRLGFQ